jgi:ABC-type branched-subunit amino acid transport system substrate-binding protein
MRRSRFLVVVALLALFALAAAACSNTDDTDAGGGGGGGGEDGEGGSYADVSTDQDAENVPVDQPGVTDDEIRVAGLVAKTNDVTNSHFDDISLGVNAYFEMINQNGGIYGRQLVHEEFDDQLLNTQAVTTELIDSEPFAVVGVAAPGFGGGAPDLAAEGIPVFGWNINAEFNETPSFFGMRGYLGIDEAGPLLPWLAGEIGATSLGVLAYGGAASEQSEACLNGIATSVDQFESDLELGFQDASLDFGFADVSGQVQQMADADVDLVTTCMDFTGQTTIGREMTRQGLEAPHYMPRAYDYDFLQEFGDEFEGSYVLLQMLPREWDPQPPSMEAFEAWMAETGQEENRMNELALSGWISADMFVTGLRLAGPEFTRETVVSGLNTLTDYTAQGLIPPMDWTQEHTVDVDGCGVIMQIENGEFVPIFDNGETPYSCLDAGPEDTEIPEQTFAPIEHTEVGLIELPGGG